MLKKFTIVSILFFIIFPVIVVANSHSSTEEALREKLIQQIIQLQAVIAALQNSSETTLNLTANLWQGVEGPNVTKLQQFLKSTGDFTYPEITGYYGTVTTLAVQRYQCRTLLICSGTPVSNGYGAVGPMTRAALSSHNKKVVSTKVVSGNVEERNEGGRKNEVIKVSTPPKPESKPKIETPVIESPVVPGLTLSEPVLVANGERTPLGQQYSDGSIILQAGTQKKEWSGTGWRTPQSTGSYTQGSMHATVSLLDNTVFAFDFGAPISFDMTQLKWYGKYLSYASPLGSLLKNGVLSIDVLPGNSVGENYEPLALMQTPKYLYMSLQRYRSINDEPWSRSDGYVSSGSAHRCESYLVRSPAEDPANFKFIGTIGNKDNYLALLQSENLDFPDIPLYYACLPRCIALSDSELVCALRGSADDDDSRRPLDPNKIFSSPTENEEVGSFDSNLIASTIYSPKVLADKYYLPKNTAEVPPLMLATSNNGGASWDHKFIAEKGGIDASFAYDKENNLLVIAYGGLTYPRKDVVVQWSRDKGRSWSDPLTISNGYTTGTAYIAHTGDNKFEVVYDDLEHYIQYNKSTKRHVKDGYKIYTRSLTFND